MSQNKITEEDISEGVLGIFAMLAGIPRKTHHEEKVSSFIFDFCRERGCQTVRDAVGNVIVEIPPSPGLENLPRVILQAHMDMVAVAEPGYDFDPLRDSVILKRDGDRLSAVGTSLGADDGIGVAAVLYILDCSDRLAHGPLRGIFTVDEEDGMAGVSGLDRSHLFGADYLVNIDSEDSDTITTSCAGGVGIEFLMTPGISRPTLDTPLCLRAGGTLGGHSGVMIDRGRVNVNIALCRFIASLRARGIGFELAGVRGGSARNAIPSSACAELLIKGSDREKLVLAAAEYSDEMNREYSDTDPGFTLSVKDDMMPENILSDASSDALLSLVTGLVNGVHRMSDKLPGLVESSSNLGVLTADASSFAVNAFARSSEYDSMEELTSSHIALGRSLGFTCEKVCPSDPWPMREHSRLLACAKKVYEEQNGEPPKTEAIHAGLECGGFSNMNPDLDMISIGPDLADVHSPDETLIISSVGKVVKWILGILREIE